MWFAALREPVAPVGLASLLTDYAIPLVGPAAWRLEVGTAAVSLGDLRVRPSHEVVAAMECAGNGRARLEPHVVSQPWLSEAVGTARWRGVPLHAVLEEAGPAERAVEVVFTGLDRGVEGGEAQSFQRSLPLDDALGSDAILAYEG